MPLETLMRGPTTDPPSVMPGLPRAAGLHYVDARVQQHRPGQPRTDPVREDGLYDIDDVGASSAWTSARAPITGTG